MSDEWRRVARERLSCWVEFMQELIASYPQRAIASFEQGGYEDPAEAVRIARFRNKDLEIVTVEPVQSILRAKPHKTSFAVLDNLAGFDLGQRIRHSR